MPVLATDTIFALATPPGMAALAIIRLSGPAVADVLNALTHKSFIPRQATLTHLRHPENNDMIDHALVTFFQGPHSFTGEDMAEFSVHGGRAVVQAMLDVLSVMPNCRLAEPGEFTRRAFLHHKLDLTEAEAIADLIHAETILQRRQALEQLNGSLKTLYDQFRDDLIHAAAYIEAHLDFPDEDLPPDLLLKNRPTLERLKEQISTHLDDGGRGEIIRDGVQVVIMGAPNVGKSSLLNALAKRDVAIVSPHAGTTRDLIDVHLDLGGYPVILTDTAGLRPDQLSGEGQDQIEAIGIERALARANMAHFKIVLFDAGDQTPDPHALALLDQNTILVMNKIDLHRDYPKTITGHDVIGLSVQTGQGLDALVQKLTTQIATKFGTHEGATLTRARHRAALQDCTAALERAFKLNEPELVAEELRVGITALARITGRIDVEDLLDVIFHDFCIGK